MKKTALLISVLFLFGFYGPKQKKVEKYTEDGVEVVNNHIEPYQINGVPTALNLEEILTIDFERDDLAKLGISDIGLFDVDSDGSIYFLDSKVDKHTIFKFDKDGKFVTSFGPKGQGPGEIQSAYNLIIDNQDNIAVNDIGNRRLSIFNKNGTLNKEISLNTNIVSVDPLESGKYLISKNLITPSGEYITQIPLILCTSKFFFL